MPTAQRQHNTNQPHTQDTVLHGPPHFLQAVKETKLSNQHLLRLAPSARVQRARTQYSFQFVKRKSSRVRTELTQPNSARRIREGGRERGAVHTASPSQNSLTFFQKLETMPNFELSPEHRILQDPFLRIHTGSAGERARPPVQSFFVLDQMNRTEQKTKNQNKSGTNVAALFASFLVQLSEI